ncbi:MAG: 16S rRNA (adenine(1518)-N(6)/adenine(1519)-N(6))-dimethyltransferase RsmA [bacterium]
MEIEAKKSLGQNFLKSEGALRKIVEAGEIKDTDTVLEIGPGLGALTEKILEKAGRVVVVEKDDRLISILNEKFSTDVTGGKLQIIHADILNFDPSIYNIQSTNYKLIANIPYYITGEIFRKFLESDNQPSQMVVLVQKEVAIRVVARDGKESLLSNSIKCFGTPRLVDTVPAGAFVPAPKVDSAILAINNISKKFFEENKISPEKFFTILHYGFAHKRKMLLGNLKEAFLKEGRSGVENLRQIFHTAGLSEKVRAEDLTLKNWAELVKQF